MSFDPLSVPTPGLDYATKRLVMASGRSWWQARYRGGSVVNEWDTGTVLTVSDTIGKAIKTVLPGPLRLGSTSRWEEISKKGLIALRLITPTGNGGVLESPQAEYRFFQLKVGHFDLAPGKSTAEAQVIGLLLPDGDSCICWSWELAERRLVRFQDRFSNMVYRGIGALSANNLGVRI